MFKHTFLYLYICTHTVYIIYLMYRYKLPYMAHIYSAPLTKINSVELLYGKLLEITVDVLSVE